MHCRIAILGAGISGLACAWFLKKRFGSQIDLTLLEASSRVGGWIQTSNQGSFLFEQGPRGCRPQGTGLVTLRLIEELNLQNQVITSNPAVQFRYLYTQQKLQKLPHNLFSFLFSPLMKGVIPALWHDWWLPKGKEQDESIYDFIARRLSSDLAEKLVDPIISGIYAGDIKKLSVKACFPWLVNYEQTYGGIVKGCIKHRKDKMPTSDFIRHIQTFPLFSFKGGMEVLTQALAQQLEADIHYHCQPIDITLQAQGVTVYLAKQEPLEFDYVISALPAFKLKDLLASWHSNLTPLLENFTYATAAVVNLGYKENVLKSKGFGYVIPQQEGEAILGCVWDSCIFSEQNKTPLETRLTVMLGGTHHKRIEKLSSQECATIALDAMHKHLGITKSPNEIVVKIASKAIPQYEVGYLDLLASLQHNLNTLAPRLKVLGSTFNGVSVNDCIARAYDIAHQLDID